MAWATSCTSLVEGLRTTVPTGSSDDQRPTRGSLTYALVTVDGHPAPPAHRRTSRLASTCEYREAMDYGIVPSSEEEGREGVWVIKVKAIEKG
ncbi:hypothetical protein MRX96_049156 [Rhipicephalus microplus]